MKKPAVFLDRDGTINEQMGYVNHLSRFVLLPGAAEAIRLLNERGYWAVVVSNQSGAARGYFPVELVEAVHCRMEALLALEGARLDGVFYCPHHLQASVPEYRMSCDCRKPRTGLIRQACERLEIDLARSYVVGDRYSDIELAHRAGLKSILVQTGYGRGELEHVLPGRQLQPHRVAADLGEAVRWIIEQGGSEHAGRRG